MSNLQVHFSSKSNEWATPQAFFDELNKEFNFTLDPCATPETAKCAKFYTEADDGLSKSWDNEIVFCNPPYGRGIKHWVKKASESRGGGCRFVDSFTYLYQLLSRFYIWQGGNTIYTWAVKVWQWTCTSTVPIYGGSF